MVDSRRRRGRMLGFPGNGGWGLVLGGLAYSTVVGSLRDPALARSDSYNAPELEQ